MERSKILIVDDKPENLISLEAILKSTGAEVIAASDAHEALAKLLQHEFALALFDVHMPEVSGIELARGIRRFERMKSLPIIFVTASNNTAWLEFEGYGEGAVDILFKPLNPSVVQSKARTFLELDQQKKRMSSVLGEKEDALQKIQVLLKQKEEAETQLIAARLAAESANRAKDVFLATLSHELRTPLNAILGWVELLEEDARQETLEEGLAALRRNTELQTTLINDLLDVSRIIAGKIELDSEVQDIACIIRDTLSMVYENANKKNVKVTWDSHNALPAVMCDRKRLQQVFLNLMSNAIKFTPGGGSVHVNATKVATGVKVSIQDSGEGISSEFLPHIFERFSQQDSSKSRFHGGLGLGLAIVDNLVKLHHGTVVAQSEGPNKGTTFEVTIPHAVDAGNAAQKPNQSRATVAAKPAPGGETLTNKRVLLVEDAPDVRKVISIILKRAGASVVEKEEAEGAYLALHEGEFDLIVSDIGLPGEDGISFIQRVRGMPHANAALPALALSGYARDEERREALEAGFDGHLPKPVNREQLLQTSETLLSLRPLAAHSAGRM